MGTYTVYIHTFPNGKRYVGITSKTPEQRWKDGLGYYHQKFVFSAILKYGWENIQHTIIATGLSKQNACEMEKELIAKFKSNNRDFGYNLDNGGFANNKMSSQTKMKISQSKKGCKGFTGKHKQESKEKMRVARINYMKRKENRENLITKMGKAIIQFDKYGNFIKEWRSARDAQKETKISHSHIGECCNNKRKSAGGYIWKFKEVF